MPRSPRTLLLTLVFAAVPVHAVGLPDTGQTICYDNSAAADVGIVVDGGTHPRQDCRYGRDPAAAAGVGTKTGAGAAGFDYTKIANDGTALAAGAALGPAAGDWACTRDNITGLTWEVKTANPGDLRYRDHTYTWYSSDGTGNGGNAGGTGFSTCNATLAGNLCNTEAYAAAVNAGAGLCAHTDWRMPTPRELSTLVYAATSNPSIDPAYFPNTVASAFWSGSSFAPNPPSAFYVTFDVGSTNTFPKANGTWYVRLVRGGQF